MYPEPDNQQIRWYTLPATDYVSDDGGYDPPHIPEAEIITFGVLIKLMALDSSLKPWSLIPENQSGSHRFDHFQIIFTETFPAHFCENICCLSQRTVHIHLKILERGQHLLLFDLREWP